MAAEDFDEKLRQRLLADLDGLEEQLREAATKTVRVQVQGGCPGGKDGKGCTCKHVRYAEVPDYKLKLSIFDSLAARAYGKPGQQESGEERERITFQRLVVLPEDEIDE